MEVAEADAQLNVCPKIVHEADAIVSKAHVCVKALCILA